MTHSQHKPRTHILRKSQLRPPTVQPQPENSDLQQVLHDPQPTHFTPSIVNRLQRMVGNQAVLGLIHRAQSSQIVTAAKPHEPSISRTPTNRVVQRFIGFEYQMLNSDVEIENRMGGDTINKWAPTPDGNNLEMKTTEVLDKREEVEQVVTQMAALGKRMSEAKSGDKIDIGNKRINIEAGDDSAQPQVNFDLPLRAMNGPFADQLHDLTKSGFFDAQNPDFGWKKKESQEQMKYLVQLIGEAQKQLKDDLIIKLLGLSEKIPPSLIADIRGYIILKFSQNFQAAQRFGKGLLKDVPMLVKTSFDEIRDKIISQLTDIIDPDGMQFGSEDKAEKRLNLLQNELLEQLRQSAEIPKDISKQVNLKTASSRGNLDDFTKSPSKSLDGESKGMGVLLELRRSPIITYDQWVGFALSAFDKLGNLFRPDLTTETEEEEDEEKTEDKEGEEEEDNEEEIGEEKKNQLAEIIFE